ncbi:MAG: hypothetical protein ACLFM5_09010 [Spirochaetaceae bacterium]
MRRILMILMVLVFVAGVAVAAGPWQDGTYTAEADEYTHGWRAFVRIEVIDGYIANVHFDEFAEEDDKTKYVASVHGEYGMVENGDAEWPWWEQADRMAAYLVETQDPSEALSSGGVDAVSSVSVTGNNFYELAEEALSDARR